MRNVLRIFTGGMAAVVLTLALATAGARAASSPSTPVHLSSAQVAQTLFVAGDVGRLSQIPSGTEDVVLEKVLQQLYTNNPALAPNQAVSDIQGLQATLSSGSQALSPATLAVMAGNQRILAVLRALAGSGPPPDVLHAVAQVTAQALTVSSQSTQYLGQAFDASADSLDTLSFTAFSPAGTLARSALMASTNSLFGQARDALWKQASDEGVLDSTQTLLGENPALQNSAIKALVNMLNPDGSLDTTVGGLESVIDGGVEQIDDQNCTVTSGTNGMSPSDCASGALHDAQVAAQSCPNGPNDTSTACQNARSQAETDEPAEIATITAQQAATAAAAAALNDADQTLGQAEAASAQAAAQLNEQENDYLNYQSTLQYEKLGTGVVSLAGAIITRNPASTFGALVNVIGAGLAIGGLSGPDPNVLILQGIKNLARQLSDFEQYTRTAFQIVDGQLASIAGQISQIATQLAQISGQLSQAQQQLTDLANQVASLQSSVDHLQSEVQSLFAQGARNDLGTLINQYIGFQHANGTPLPQTQFAQAAGALYQDATSTALTPTLLTIPTTFDALGADSLLTGSDPLTLDTNINLFNAFGAAVSDAPGITWPGALTTTCAANANPAEDLCLPDPDFWATSARAFSQLLMENPSYVTPTRITQLQAIQQEGQLIATALAQLSANNAGTDASGTGNQTLDAAISYFRYWGDANSHANGAPPSLWQALKNEEQRYLAGATLNTAPQETAAGVDPWADPTRPLDLAGVLKLSSFNNIPLCPGYAAAEKVAATSYELPSLPQSAVSFLNPAFLNAARLGQGTIAVCWGGGGQIENDGPNHFDLTAIVDFSYTSADGAISNQVIGTTFDAAANVPDCAGSNPSNPGDGLGTIVDGWEGRNSACPDLSTGLGQEGSSTSDQSAPADVASAVESELLALRRGVYNDIIGAGTGLTAGGSLATDVQQAASRLDGANALLNGYVSLGLPQALTSDNTLESLISGSNADTFDPTNSTVAGVAPASGVPAQIVNLYQAEINDDTATNAAVTDPADIIASLVDQRASALAAAINPHITGSGGAQSASLVFAEENPYIAPTIDRLDETALVLSDEMTSPPATTGAPTPPSTPTPASTPPVAGTPITPPASATTTTAKCTLTATSAKVLLRAPKGKPKKGAPKPGTLSLAVKCNHAGKVKLTGTLIQLIGTKPQHGKQKSKTYRLGPVTATIKAGSVLTVRVKVPTAALSALGHQAKESATFTVTFAGRGANGRATARTATLKATR